MPESKRVREIFESAVELTAADRSSYLDQVCASDTELRRMVEELLAADAAADEADVGFERPIAAELMDGDTQDPVIGTRIGSYRILRVLGSGA